MIEARRRDRVHAYLIDFLPFLGAIVLLGFVAGSFAQTAVFAVGSRLVFGAYLLLRDLPGASFGKRARKLAIVAADGQPADGTQLFLRNITIAAAPFCADIPVAAQAMLVLLGLEIVLLLVRGSRLGDMLAGTRVVDTAPRPAPAAEVIDAGSSD
jgi:uncharacterized RDD family membrane protein YckC